MSADLATSECGVIFADHVGNTCRCTREAHGGLDGHRGDVIVEHDADEPPAPSAGLRRSVRHAGRRTYVSLYDGKLEGLDTDGGRWQIVCERHGSILSIETLRQAQIEVHGDPAEFCEDCAEGDRPSLCKECGWPEDDHRADCTLEATS